MFEPQQYELIDFGGGRKLERFGTRLVDRPAPAADDSVPLLPAAWKEADLRYERKSATSGKWRPASVKTDWQVQHASIRFRLQPTPFGHVGLFPEQAANWDWIFQQSGRQPLKVLNLFACTGGSTLAAAAAGAAVTHVDAARNVVHWARQNAALSGLADATIRWIVEDARKYVKRELRRESHYDAVILDPPSYGHGPTGDVWKIGEHLLPLLADCARLVRHQPRFVLLTNHSPGFGPAELEAVLADTMFGSCQAGATARTMYVETSDGRRLASGVAARWPG